MDMWQKWGCDIEEELKRNVFLALWGIFGIELWKCGKSGGATFRKRQRKDDFLLSGGFLEFDFGHMAKVGVRHSGRDREKKNYFLLSGEFLESNFGHMAKVGVRH